MDSGKKAEDLGGSRGYGKEIEKVNEGNSYREQKVHILNSLDK